MIASTANPMVKQVTALHTAKGREKQQRCIAEGIRTLKTLINAGWQAEAIYATSALYQDALNQLPKTTITEVSDVVMKKMSAATTPSGILGVFPIPRQPNPNELSTGMVLAGIADPGNMGTLIRTCAAFGKRSVVIIGGCDPYSPKVIQSSAGTVARMDIFEWTWQELLNHKQSLELIALVAQGGSNPSEITSAESLIVIGSEAHGIPSEWVATCQKKVTIPMPGGTESLNAAVAGAIAFYTIWFRQK